MSEVSHDYLQEYARRNLCHNWPKVSEIGPFGDNVRFDVVDVNRPERKIKIFEIKTSRSDFLGDHKWEKYLNYCDYFAFVCPKGIIEVSDLPDKIGLVYVEQKAAEVEWHMDLEHEYIRNSSRLKRDLEGYIKVVEQIASRKADGG